MTEQIDWPNIRANKFNLKANLPNDWPKDLNVISMEGLTLFGIDNQNNLFWDGKELEIKKAVSLRGFERTLAFFVALSGVTIALLEALKFFGVNQ